MADFPFIQMIGLSSYPYLGFARPEDIPSDYYSRIIGDRALRIMVCEWGWSSAGVGAVSSSPEMQARYIRRRAELSDSIDAEAVAQTLFADLDIDGFTDLPQNLPLFIFLGLMDKDFHAKPALEGWDALFARKRIPFTAEPFG